MDLLNIHLKINLLLKKELNNRVENVIKDKDKIS